MFYKFFWYLSILWPLRSVLAFKTPYFESGIQIWTKGTLKHLTRCFESISESTNFPVYNLDSIATSAAFLAFTALKLKKIQICQ